MRPAIGIPPCLDARGRWKPGRTYHYLDAAAPDALAECGAQPVLLPLQPDADALVARLDGLLVPGGDDFLPEAPYPEGVRFDPVAERQLAFDRALLEAALRRDLPVLGLCYGMQLLALHGGGRLHHDLPTDLPGAAPHRLDPGATHPLEIAEGSRLAAILGTTTTSVNSWHHQAVAEPGAGARASAWAPDGVIEAIELDAPRFALGVQWHPEKEGDPHGRRLLAAFVEACGGAGSPSAPRG